MNKLGRNVAQLFSLFGGGKAAKQKYLRYVNFDFLFEKRSPLKT